MRPYSLLTHLSLALVFIVLNCYNSLGSHYMGVDIAYECLGTCTYRIYHNTYYDCSGALMASFTPVSNGNAPGAPTDFDFDFVGVPLFPGQNCNDPVPLTATWQFVSYVEVTPVCPSTNTECEANTAPIRGVAEARYSRDYDFCNTNCDVYDIEWSGCCRNNAITSLVGPGSQEIFTGQTRINTAITPCNSSPQFSNPPTPYLCAGQPFTFNQGAFDPDGDSLVYSLGQCFDNNGIPVNYGPGYSPIAPLGPNWNVSIDPFTGDISITPNPNGPVEVGVLCVRVDEYRNGVRIGQVVRDIQITVIDCGALGQTNISPTITSLTNLSPGATANGLTVTTCACDLVSFDIPSMDPDQGQNFIMYWNKNLDAVFADANNPNIPVDTVTSSGVAPTGHFSWVPTETGLHTFLVTVQDDGCPLFGLNQYTIVIDVTSCSLDPYINTTPVNCFDIEFEGFPCGGAPPFTYAWSGSDGLSGTGQTLVHNYSGPGTYTYSVTITDSTGVSSSANGTITLSNTATADAGPDLTLCPGQIGTVGTPAVPGYTYQWSSPNNVGWSGASNPSTAQGNVTFNNGTSSAIVIPYFLAATDANGCTNYDTVEVTYTPTPPSNFVVTNTVCVDEPATAVYSAPTVPGSVYTWVYGGGGTGTNTGPGPHNITWSNPGLQSVKLVVDVNGCVSDTTEKLVRVNPIPTASFTATTQVCANQPALFNYTGSGDPNSSTFIWDFDGGNGAGGAGPFTVTWPSPGTKTVSLTVVDKGCVSAVFTRTVDVFQVPSSSFSIASTVCEEGPVQITYTGTGSSGAAYTWNFNGAQIQSGSGVGPYTVSWNTPGTRTVTLQVEENGCISSLNSQDIDVLADPVASISQVANQCLSGNSFAFLSSGDNDVDNYFWDFGADAQPPTSTAATPPAVSYLNPGIKTVSLVTIRSGCISDSAKISFEIVPEPSANFTTSSSGICDTECITYTYSGQSLGPLQSFNWDFGPGSIPPGSSLPNPGCIEYALPGTKDVTLTVDFKGCVTSTTQQVTINASPQISAGADVDFCEGDGGVQIDASVTGGTSPLFYSWTCDDPPNCGLSSNSIEDPFANPHAIISGAVADTITYYLEVSDVNGCASGKDSVRVIVKAKPIMDAGPDVFICTDGPGDFITGGVAAGNNAPFPITFLWTPASGLNDNRVANPFARPDTTTIYTLQGSSVNGCNSEVNTLDTLSTVTVHVLPKPVAFAGRDTAICLSESVMLQGFAAGGGPDYSYSWTPATPGTIDDPNSATPLVSPNFSTTFSLVVTSNGCDSDADQVEVLVGTQPTITPGAAETICLRDSVQLNGAAAGDPNASSYTYSWSPAIGLSNPNIAKPKASPAVTTTYKVKASSNFGCGSDEAEIIVTVEPTPEVMALSADTVICQGDTINLRATHSFTTPAGSPVVYDWTPENGVLDAASQPEVRIAPGQTTLYTVQASIAGDCPTTDQVLVTVSPRVDASLSADTTQFCEGDATQLTATGGRGNATFTWMPPTGLDDPTSATPMASPNTTTTYVVEIREGACADTDEITLTINPRPEADYFASQADGCLGMTVSFIENTTDGIAFQWDFGDGSPVSNEANPSHTYEQAGSYVVTLTTIGVGGCEASVSSTTVNVSGNSFADFTSNPIVDQRLALPQASVNFADLSQNAQSWFWDFGDGKISTEKDPAHSFEQAGSYTVSLTVTDQNGCTSTISYGPYEVFEPEVMIPNVFTPNQDGVNDAFKVDYNGNELFNMVVFDRWGRQFYQADAPDKPWDGTDSEGNPAQEGVYYYSVSIGEKNFSGNVTLMR